MLVSLRQQTRVARLRARQRSPTARIQMGFVIKKLPQVLDVIAVVSNTNFLLDVLTELDNERAERDGIRDMGGEMM